MVISLLGFNRTWVVNSRVFDILIHIVVEVPKLSRTQDGSMLSRRSFQVGPDVGSGDGIV